MTQTTAEQHMAASLLRRAGELRDAGKHTDAAAYEALADTVGATCPHCGGQLIPPPDPHVDFCLGTYDTP